METREYHVLLVGDQASSPAFLQASVYHSAEVRLCLSHIDTYSSAIQAIQQQTVDLILVQAFFDGHRGLELIHHTHLIDPHLPVVLLCDEYSDSLDYQSRKAGALDCVSMRVIDLPLLRSYLSRLISRPNVKNRSKSFPGGFQSSADFHFL